MRNLSKRHKQIQKEIVYNAWENYKAEITMEELAHIFRKLPRSTRTFYRIIKGRKNKDQ